MLKTWNNGKPTAEFNNAAQVVNHTFFWESMGPNKGGLPRGSWPTPSPATLARLRSLKRRLAQRGPPNSAPAGRGCRPTNPASWR